MKKLATALAALLLLSPALFAANDAPPEDTKVVFMQGQPTGSIKKITVNLKSENLVVSMSEDENISIRIDSNDTTSVPQVVFNAKEIKIDQKAKIKKQDKRICIITLSMPKDFNLQEMKINAEKSDLMIMDANIQKLTISTGDKGSVNLSGIKGQDLDIKTDKGDVSLETLDCDKTFKLVSSDGNVTLKDLKTTDFTLEAEKGKISADGIKAKKISVNADKASAKIVMDSTFEKDSVIYVSSGSAVLQLPPNAVLWTAGTVDKGRFRSEFTEDSKGALLSIKVGGGDLQIQKK